MSRNEGDTPFEAFGNDVVCVKPFWWVEPVVVVTCEKDLAKLARMTVLSFQL